MKKIISRGIYFLLCATVITAAIVAGKNHDHCHECSIAFTDKEKEKEAAPWTRIISRGEMK